MDRSEVAPALDSVGCVAIPGTKSSPGHNLALSLPNFAVVAFVRLGDHSNRLEGQDEVMAAVFEPRRQKWVLQPGGASPFDPAATMVVHNPSKQQDPAKPRIGFQNMYVAATGAGGFLQCDRLGDVSLGGRQLKEWESWTLSGWRLEAAVLDSCHVKKRSLYYRILPLALPYTGLFQQLSMTEEARLALQQAAAAAAAAEVKAAAAMPRVPARTRPVARRVSFKEVSLPGSDGSGGTEDAAVQRLKAELSERELVHRTAQRKQTEAMESLQHKMEALAAENALLREAQGATCGAEDASRRNGDAQLVEQLQKELRDREREVESMAQKIGDLGAKMREEKREAELKVTAMKRSLARSPQKATAVDAATSVDIDVREHVSAADAGVRLRDSCDASTSWHEDDPPRQEGQPQAQALAQQESPEMKTLQLPQAPLRQPPEEDVCTPMFEEGSSTLDFSDGAVLVPAAGLEDTHPGTQDDVVHGAASKAVDEATGRDADTKVVEEPRSSTYTWTTALLITALIGILMGYFLRYVTHACSYSWRYYSHSQRCT
eukprot:jgi/Mesvir1/9706/Mv12180-RA.1